MLVRSLCASMLLVLGGCAGMPFAVNSAKSLSVEQSFPRSPDQVSLCLMQELNVAYPQMSHNAEMLERNHKYRIYSGGKVLVFGNRAITDITFAGNLGTRVVFTVANSGEGAAALLDKLVAAGQTCLRRMGAEAAPPPPRERQWEGYTAPDQ